MDTGYFEKSENICRGYFTHFNNRTGFFHLITDHYEDKGIIDLTAMDRKGRNCNIELKCRECHINTFETLFIEDKKWDELKKEWEERHFIPIYINFMQDGNHVWFCDLRPYFEEKKEIRTKLVDINNTGYGRYDLQVLRYLLPVRDGVYYELDSQMDRYKRKW